MTTTTRPRTDEAALQHRYDLLEALYAELLAHARASVAAARLNQSAPLALLEGCLEERGQNPQPGALPEVEAARAYAAAVDVYALAGDEPCPAHTPADHPVIERSRHDG